MYGTAMDSPAPTTFDALGAHPSLQRALTARGYAEATPVQAAVLAPANRGVDLLVSAQTGSGKTVAFGLALAELLLGEAQTLPRATTPLALVVAPTRELALQVQRELAWLYAPAGGRVAACVGGVELSREVRALREGAHIVVGTPGRLVDHLDRKSLQLASLKAVVLDEADEMLDMGFREELERILGAAPKERRTLLFSATIPKEIGALAQRYQRAAVRVAATPTTQAHADIAYRAHLVSPKEREHAVVNVLRAADAAAIVFCNTRDGVTHLHASLVERGFAAVALSGELTQPERTRALKALRDGRARVLVATDVAARGLDLPDVALVVHADLPTNAEGLQHRSGRTGRAGKKGVSVLLVPAPKRAVAERLMRTLRVTATWAPVPTPEAIAESDRARLVKSALEETAETTDEDLAIGKLLLAERTAEQLAAALAAVYRARLPAPEEVPLSLALSKPKPREPFVPRAHAAAERSPAPGAAEPSPAPGAAAPPRPHTPRVHGAFAWFAVDVGRSKHADPRWLLPLICRRGGVTKAEVGAIKILADETRFEIVTRASAAFARSVQRPDKADRNVKFTPSEPPSAREPKR